MLGKLIKHDFKAMARILIPTLLAIIALTIIATVVFPLNYDVSMNYETDGNIIYYASSFILPAVIMLLVLMIIASLAIVSFMIFYHFYKSCITEQGYLTFTLPTTATNILWSKLITAVLWMLITGLAIFLCVNVFLAFGTTMVPGNWYLDFLHRIPQLLKIYFTPQLSLVIIEILVSAFLTMVFQILHVYLALLIGGLVAQKQKVWAGIGFYFAIAVGVSTISSIGQTILSQSILDITMNNPGMGLSMSNILGLVQINVLPTIVFEVILIVSFFLLCRHLMKNHLNLA